MKHALLFALVFCPCSIFAQDVIVKKDGSTILSKVLEVGQSEIKYKKIKNPDGPTYTIGIADIISINYENGEKDDFNSASTAEAQQQVTTQPSVDNDFAKLTPEDEKANAEVLQRWMEKSAVYGSKPKSSNAVLLFCVCKPTSSSMMADANMELSFRTVLKEGQIADKTEFVITARNKTKKTIYLDLANTFFARGKQSAPFYVPSATSATSGGSVGLGANVGQLSGLGGNLNGLSVGGSSSKFNTTITYSQRIIAIPPMSEFDLPAIAFFPNKDELKTLYGDVQLKSRSGRYGNPTKIPHFATSNIVPSTIGQVRDYDENQLNFKFGVYLSYAFTEDAAALRSLNVDFNIRRIIGVPEAREMGFVSMTAKMSAISPSMADEVYVIMWRNN